MESSTAAWPPGGLHCAPRWRAQCHSRTQDELIKALRVVRLHAALHARQDAGCRAANPFSGATIPDTPRPVPSQGQLYSTHIQTLALPDANTPGSRGQATPPHLRSRTRPPAAGCHTFCTPREPACRGLPLIASNLARAGRPGTAPDARVLAFTATIAQLSSADLSALRATLNAAQAQRAITNAMATSFAHVMLLSFAYVNSAKPAAAVAATAAPTTLLLS